MVTAQVRTTADASETVVDELGFSDEPGAAALVAEVEAAERARALDRPRLDAVVHRHAVRHSHRPHEHRPDAAGRALAGGRRRRRHAHRRRCSRCSSSNPSYLAWRAPTRWIERRLWRRYFAQSRTRHAGTWLDRVVAAWLRFRLTTAIRMRELRYSVPATLNRGLQTGLPDRRDHRRDRSGLGHELVLRHRELGGRDVELVGRVADRHLARGDGARGAGAEGGRAGPATFAVTPAGVGLRRLLVHRHRRHRRRRRLAARAARPAAVGGEQSRRALRRHLVGRRVSDRRDERLRSQVLAALQGRDTAGLRDSRQPRLVRRARELSPPRSSSRTPRAPACARASRRTCA